MKLLTIILCLCFLKGQGQATLHISGKGHTSAPIKFTPGKEIHEREEGTVEETNEIFHMTQHGIILINTIKDTAFITAESPIRFIKIDDVLYEIKRTNTLERVIPYPATGILRLGSGYGTYQGTFNNGMMSVPQPGMLPL